MPLTWNETRNRALALPALKTCFKAYATSDQIRDIIESGHLTGLATNPVFSTKDFRSVSAKYRTAFPTTSRTTSV